MELVTGATGYVGNRLLRRLVAEGRPVRTLARRPELLTDVDVVRGDLLTGSGLEEALYGCSTAYYLVHSMEAAANGDFAGRDRRMAESFGEAAARAGVERIVYLGGIVPAGHALSPHLKLQTRGRGDPARRGARLHRPARVHRHRRGVVEFSHSRSPRGTVARPPVAALAPQPAPSPSTSAT